MKLIIESCLSEPPSEISCFRDVTLYARTYKLEDVLLECPPGTRSMYWSWLKGFGAHDFISYLIIDTERESGFTLKTDKRADISVDKITCDNLNYIISKLK